MAGTATRRNAVAGDAARGADAQDAAGVRGEGGGSVAAAGITTALWRVVVGFRLVGAVWVALLCAVAVSSDDLGVAPALGLVVLVAVWAALSAALGARRPLRFGKAWLAPATVRPGVPAPRAVPSWWLAADLVVALVTILAPLVVAADPAVSVHGGYPFSAVLLAAWAAGMRGGLTAALVLSAAATWRAVVIGVEVLPEAIGSVLVYLFGAAVVAWGIGVIERTDAAQRRLSAALAEERTERLRADERAETAAALHDSVLQTLALLQRRADDPAAVATLARSEERALRRWLAGGRFGADGEVPATFAAAATAVAAEVEARHGVRVDVVTVGDATLDDDLDAVVAALREALANAAEHAGVTVVDCYAEVAAHGVTAFVRDRGAGFDPAVVAADRRGIAESIVGRLTRRGGTATVRSRPGAGTEVELVLPRAAGSEELPPEP